jgi:hypothetical protein
VSVSASRIAQLEDEELRLRASTRAMVQRVDDPELENPEPSFVPLGSVDVAERVSQFQPAPRS